MKTNKKTDHRNQFPQQASVNKDIHAPENTTMYAIRYGNSGPIQHFRKSNINGSESGHQDLGAVAFYQEILELVDAEIDYSKMHFQDLESVCEEYLKIAVHRPTGELIFKIYVAEIEHIPEPLKQDPIKSPEEMKEQLKKEAAEQKSKREAHFFKKENKPEVKDRIDLIFETEYKKYKELIENSKINA
ncbi:MAG: hypothetical protein JKY54_01595 [Flavobacteriales bacterium]|nr:hypothetical protein [Flavobacteriales bacterium]